MLKSTLGAAAFSVLLAGTAGTAGTAGAQPAAAAVDRAVATYRALNSLRAEFVQTISNPLTGTRLSSRGEFVRRGSRLAINFSEPAGDRIVADGRAVWVYVPSTAPGQVVKFSANNLSATRVDPASQFLDRPRERFTITDGGLASVGGRSTREVILVPRGQDAPFTRARVWIDDSDGTIRQFEITEQTGLVRRVEIIRLQRDVAVRPSAFVFTPPPGTRVIEAPQ